MINGEGGRIAEENRVDYVMDKTETTGTVWLGLTFNCCRCHDHKFDPLTQRDYYRLFAFFNQTPVDGGGGNPQTKPVVELPPRTGAEDESLRASQGDRIGRGRFGTAELSPRGRTARERGEFRGLPKEMQRLRLRAAEARFGPDEKLTALGKPTTRTTLASWTISKRN